MIRLILSSSILPIDFSLPYIFVLFSYLHSQVNYFFLIFMIHNSLILFFLHSLSPYLYDGIISPATIEGTFTPLPPPTQAWITIAAANVLPEVLLRLASSIISARGYNISRYATLYCCPALPCPVLSCPALPCPSGSPYLSFLFLSHFCFPCLLLFNMFLLLCFSFFYFFTLFLCLNSNGILFFTCLLSLTSRFLLDNKLIFTSIALSFILFYFILY